MGHEDHGFEEPSRMRQVPFGGTRIRHRLHSGIGIRERHSETSARLPDGTIEQREFDRLQRRAKKVCGFHRSGDPRCYACAEQSGRVAWPCQMFGKRQGRPSELECLRQLAGPSGVPLCKLFGSHVFLRDVAVQFRCNAKRVCRDDASSACSTSCCSSSLRTRPVPVTTVSLTSARGGAELDTGRCLDAPETSCRTRGSFVIALLRGPALLSTATVSV
jgi:hypothetical protein